MTELGNRGVRSVAWSLGGAGGLEGLRLHLTGRLSLPWRDLVCLPRPGPPCV